MKKHITNQKHEVKGKPIIIIGLIFLAFMAMMIIIDIIENGSPTYSSPAYNQKPDLYWSACSMAKEFISRNLKSPSTAKFPICTEMQINDLGNNKWHISTYVDAENSFGAMIRTNFEVDIIHLDNKQWQLENINSN